MKSRQSKSTTEQDGNENRVIENTPENRPGMRRSPFDQERGRADHDRQMNRNQKKQRHSALGTIGFEDQRDTDENRIRLRRRKAGNNRG